MNVPFVGMNETWVEKLDDDGVSAGRVPPGHRLIEVHGLVHDLLTAGDPEYQWLDKIRTPRATNEARQSLLRRLSSELTRKIGRKVLEMGANALLGLVDRFED